MTYYSGFITVPTVSPPIDLPVYAAQYFPVEEHPEHHAAALAAATPPLELEEHAASQHHQPLEPAEQQLVTKDHP